MNLCQRWIPVCSHLESVDGLVGGLDVAGEGVGVGVRLGEVLLGVAEPRVHLLGDLDDAVGDLLQLQLHPQHFALNA